MNILMINGSPHEKGTTALLKEKFKKGALENGHTINEYDAAKELVHPCIACDSCRRGISECIFKDGMEILNPMLFQSDIIVFVTPLYYFGMSTQIKAVIDRFYANNTKLREMPKKVIILASCGDTDDDTFDAMQQHITAICKYMHWTEIGSVYALGMYVREDIEASHYPTKAYELGKSL